MSTATGLLRERAVAPAAYTIAGLEPRIAVRPASTEEAAEALGAASRDGLAVVLWGGGTRVSRSIPARGYDVALDLSALDRVLEFEPEDLTITAQCGATLASLAAAVSARGHELPLESPRAARATLGGTLAWNGSGPRRRRFGAPVDRILGARFALADGTTARSGGKVVKNVAGHAVHRLLCGSRGGLALVLEASLKLLPRPESRIALLFPLKDWQLAEETRWKALPRLEPSFVTVLGARAAAALPQGSRPDAPYLAVVGIEEDRAWAAEQEKAVAAALGPSAARLEGDDVSALLQSLCDAEDQDGARLTLASAHLAPVALAPFLRLAEAERLVFHAPAGRLHWFPADEVATSLVLELHRAGFHVIEARGPVGFQQPIAPQAALAPLRERIRRALDPAETLSGAR